MARALLGKYEGDEATVEAPKSQIIDEIVSVAFNGNGTATATSRPERTRERPAGSSRRGALYYSVVKPAGKHHHRLAVELVDEAVF